MVTPQSPLGLFSPLQVGDMKLSHRAIMGPLTRARCPDSKPNEMVIQYYTQRASPGGLIISEGIHPSIMGGNYHNCAGIFTEDHIQAWKLVTDAVHAKGAFIFCQIWHVGRAAVAIQLGGRQPLSSSATKINFENMFTSQGGRVPMEMSKAMTIDEIHAVIDEHVHAAKCAVAAGFDGVEIIAANGYLCNQFICDGVNFRTDTYGGKIENRARLILRILDAVSAAIGPSKTAVRFSPWGTVLIPLDSDPLAIHSYILEELDNRGLAYVCLTQPRSDLFVAERDKFAIIQRAAEEEKMRWKMEDVSLKLLLEKLKNTTRFVNGGYDDTNCYEDIENGTADAIVFSRHFISNPDLVERIRNKRQLTPLDRTTFYQGGSKGYTDYSTWEDGPWNAKKSEAK